MSYRTGVSSSPLAATDDAVGRNERVEPPPTPRRRRAPAATTARAWLMFAGAVLVTAVLRWAEAVFVPVALAVLLTFLLNTPVTLLTRWMRRSVAVSLVVMLSLSAMLLLGWILAYQVTSLAEELPAYRENIRTKIADVRGASDRPWIQRLQFTLDDIQRELRRGQAPAETTPTPVVVAGDTASATWGLPAWSGSVFNPLGTLAVVIILVTFMLLEYGELRDRLLAAIGYGYLADTTKAFDEAASRLSRYLATQLLINCTYGALTALGLWLIGVPYPFLWGAVGALMRFVPYVGPWIGATAPILMSLAVFPDWDETLWTVGLMVSLELLTNLVLETVFYAGAVGVSQVALLIALAFWTWLWGPIGLLLGMPLTVCLVVLAKHVPALGVFRLLMTDAPALTPPQAFYQRILAGHDVEARELLADFADERDADDVYDAVLLPALNYARRDRRDRRISSEVEAAIAAAVLANLPDPSESTEDTEPRADDDRPEEVTDVASAPTLRVLGYPAHGPTSEVALSMLAAVSHGLPIHIDIAPRRMLVSEMVEAVKTGGYHVVCVADLPPHSLSKVRYALARLRQSCPAVKVLVGRWAPEGFAPDARTELMAAGATDVATTLLATKGQLRSLLQYASEPTTVPGAA